MTLDKLFNIINLSLLTCKMGLIAMPTSWSVMSVQQALVSASGKEGCDWWGRKVGGITYKVLSTVSDP